MRKIAIVAAAAALLGVGVGTAAAVPTSDSARLINEDPGGSDYQGYLSSCGWYRVNIPPPNQMMYACFSWLPNHPEINYWDPFDPGLMQ